VNYCQFWFLKKYFRIKGPAVWVVSETSKNRQFMQKDPGKDSWLSDFSKKKSSFFPILENCGL